MATEKPFDHGRKKLYPLRPTPLTQRQCESLCRVPELSGLRTTKTKGRQPLSLHRKVLTKAACVAPLGGPRTAHEGSEHCDEILAPASNRACDAIVSPGRCRLIESPNPQNVPAGPGLGRAVWPQRSRRAAAPGCAGPVTRPPGLKSRCRTKPTFLPSPGEDSLLVPAALGSRAEFVLAARCRVF